MVSVFLQSCFQFLGNLALSVFAIMFSVFLQSCFQFDYSHVFSFNIIFFIKIKYNVVFSLIHFFFWGGGGVSD